MRLSSAIVQVQDILTSSVLEKRSADVEALRTVLVALDQRTKELTTLGNTGTTDEALRTHLESARNLAESDEVEFFPTESHLHDGQMITAV